MPDNFGIAVGTDATIAADEVGGVLFQRVKVALGADGVAVDLPGDATFGARVDVSRVAGNVTVVAGAGAPLAVRPSDGSVFLSTFPVSGSVAATAAAGAPLAVRFSDGSSFVSTVPVSGVVTISDGGGSVTVDGAVTANQGSAAAIAGGWPVKLTDGANSVAVVGDALKVVGTLTAGGGQVDKTSFAEGGGAIQVAGAVFNETITSAPSEDQMAALRMTARRGLHANLRRDDGAEIGVAGLPIRTDPTGTTTQPVSGTVTANQGGAPWAVYQSAAVQWRADVDLTASMSATVVRTPVAPRRLLVCGIILTMTGAGVVNVFEETAAAGNYLFRGTAPVGVTVIPFSSPHRFAAVNALLRVSTGSGAVGTIVAYGIEELNP